MSICAFQGQPCECEVGLVVSYSSYKFKENGEVVIDREKPSKAATVNTSEPIKCDQETFGEGEGNSCFCGDSSIGRFCNFAPGQEIEIGCYGDSEIDRDFDTLLSSEINSVEECLKLAFDNFMNYAGLQEGK